MSFIHYRTQGFVLKKNNQGENNQLLTVYTKDFGRLEVLGKSIRKISSKLRSGVELFYLSEIEFIQGKAYKILTDAILINDFKNLRKGLTGMSVAFKVSAAFEGLIKGQEADGRIWHLTEETFKRLNEVEKEKQKIKIISPSSFPEEGKLEIIYYFFLWTLFSLLGYKPELYNCLQCRKGLILEKLYFNSESGGIICHNCFKKLKSGQEVKVETIKILRIILEKNWIIFSKLKIKKLHLKALNEISDYYFSEVLKQNE